MLPLASKLIPFVLFALALGTSLSAEKSLLRREKKGRQSVQKPSPEISTAFSKLWQKGGRDKTRQALEPQESHEITDKKDSMCNDVFPVGVAGKNQCVEPNFDYMVIDEDMCQDAAQRVGFVYEGDHFIVPESNWWNHPRGCFKIPCSHATSAGGHMENATDAEKAALSGYCYFYNPVGINPPDDNGQLTGAPVCYRPKIIRGSFNLTSQKGECRAGFQVIQKDNECEEAASCLGLCTGQDLHGGHLSVSSAVNSNFVHYPEGCFIENTSGCVFINTRPNNWITDPANITLHHTPLCNVSADTLATDWPTSAHTTAAPST